jgi:hypothetical protein
MSNKKRIVTPRYLQYIVERGFKTAILRRHICSYRHLPTAAPVAQISLSVAAKRVPRSSYKLFLAQTAGGFM